MFFHNRALEVFNYFTEDRYTHLVIDACIDTLRVSCARKNILTSNVYFLWMHFIHKLKN